MNNSAKAGYVMISFEKEKEIFIRNKLVALKKEDIYLVHCDLVKKSSHFMCVCVCVCCVRVERVIEIG